MRVLHVLGLCLAVTACGTPGEKQGQRVELDYLDSSVFDRKLSAVLREEPEEVTIRFLAPVTANDVPKRLDRWFHYIESRFENELKLEPDPAVAAPKGITGVALALASKGYEVVRDEHLYGAARDYDATVFYVPGEGRLTRVVLKKQPAAVPTD